MPTYVLGFNIADVRSLELQEGQVMADVFLTVECCGKRWESEVKEEQANQFIVWNEKKIWSDITMLEEEFQTAYIEFGVYTRNWFSRNYCVGKANLQLRSINDRLNHVYAKKSIPLTKAGCTEPTGVMTMTVYCLKENEPPPNDSQMEADEQNNPENDDLTTAVCGEKIDTGDGRPHMVYIDIFKVEKLPDLGWNSFPSPYVTVEFAGNMVRTDTAPNVERYNFNTQVRIPVMTPVYEDTILIKLWTNNLMGSDELLAQGMISFSALRNSPLAPRWFQLYGYDSTEITHEQVQEIARGGENVMPNCFKGSLLLGGRVECFDSADQLQAANKGASKAFSEPALSQRTLLADVYEVCGAIGRESLVELSVAKQKLTTKWCTSSWAVEQEDDENEEEADPTEICDEATSFKYSDVVGRIESMTCSVPTAERNSRPLVMINIYTRGVLSAQMRIGWKTIGVHEIGSYEAGNPGRPIFYALNCMPYNTEQKTPATVLMCLQQSPSESVQRHNRKFVRPMQYIVRAYIFMAREIKAQHPQDFRMRLSCAGTSKMTGGKKEVRPMWMQPLDMKVTLSSDHKDEPPTMEPITVTLTTENEDIGKSVCQYEYLRRMDSRGTWEAFKLQPQWIQLTGGGHGTVNVGEVLIAFELLPIAHRKQLTPRIMWPTEGDFDPLKDFAMLRKATLHFSLLGLRDIVCENTNPLTKFGKPIPEVEVLVKKFISIPSSSKESKYYSKKFKFKDVIKGGDKKNKEDLLHSWPTNSLGRTGCMNFEFFQACKLNVKLPSNMLLEPFITVKVKMKWEVPNPLGGVSEIGDVLIGDHRRGLNKLFPCCWYGGVDPFSDNLEEQMVKIRAQMQIEGDEAKVRGTFQEETADARKHRYDADRLKQFDLALLDSKASVKKEVEIMENTGPAGLPPEFLQYDAKVNPKGIGGPNGEKDSLEICTLFNMRAWEGLNYQGGSMFSPRLGEKTKVKGQGGGNEMIMGNFENRKLNPKCDFRYSSQPLLRDHDVIDIDDTSLDWSFQYNNCFGFVKCMFMLTDGWEEPLSYEPGSDLEGDENGGEGGLLNSAREAFAKIGLGMQEIAIDIEEEVDEDFDPLVDAETMLYGQDRVPVYILTDDSIERAKTRFLKDHARELYEHVKPNEPKLGVPPSNPNTLRKWILGVQTQVLKTRRLTDLQKEFRKIVNNIEEQAGDVIRAGLKGKWGHNVLDPMQALSDIIQPDRRDVDGNKLQCVAYSGMVKVGMFELLVLIEESVVGGQGDNLAADIKALAAVIRQRGHHLRALSTSYNFQKKSKWAFDERSFFDHWREATPARLRVRLYFVRAICIFGKAYGSADPYIKFTLGTEENSLRNDPRWGTNEPEFYRVEERDLELPAQSRLQIDLQDVGDVPEALTNAMGKQDAFDSIIGSSILDLEDRWHSDELQKCNRSRTAVPKESRTLWSVEKLSGKATVTGSFMLWIEMINSTEAADKKASPLQQPPPTEIELRFVIWSCANCKLVDNGKIDVRVGITLQCEEYMGPHPAAQKTDTHHGSLGDAVFEWRMVYPKIVMPSKSCIVSIALYDYNLIAGDIAVGSLSLDIKKFVEKVASSMDSLTKSSTLFFKSALDEDEGVNIGEVKLDMMILPQGEAKLKPAGIERSEPNENPQLMTPMEGRGWDNLLAGFAFSLPSFGFYKKFLPLILFTLLALVGLKYVGLL